MLRPQDQSRPLCEARLLDTVNYRDGLDLQAALVSARKRGDIPDTLLLLDHPPTITLGRRAALEDVLIDPDRLADEDIELCFTNRGGLVTYHGPGQLVFYPIIDLRPDRCDAHRYLRDLEEVVLRTLADLGISAHRQRGLTGVWVGNEKIAAIGVHFSNWITSHGVALNVSTRLDWFNLIIPCGLDSDMYGVTSIQELSHGPVDPSLLRDRLVHHFGEVFQRRMKPLVADQESVQVLILTYDLGRAEVLLLKRTNDRGGFWQPVTGLIESGESPELAAARELREETGIQSKPQNLGLVQCFRVDSTMRKQGSDQRPCINREHSFAVEIEKGPPCLDPKEHTTAQWLKVDVAANLVRWDSARRALRLAIRRRANLFSS